MRWSTTTATGRSPTRPTGDGAIFAIAEGRAGRARAARRAHPPVRGRSGAGRPRHREHGAPRRLPGRDRGGSGREAGRAPGRVVRHAGGRAGRSGGDPHGEGGRRAGPRDPRGAPGAGPRPGRDPQRPEAEARAGAARSAPRSTFLQEQVDAADADITSAAERLVASSRPSSRDCGRRRSCLRQRVVVLEDGMAVWRERLGDAEPLPDEMPELPPHAAATRVGTGGGRDAAPRPQRCSTRASSSSAPSATRSPRTTRSSCAPSWRLPRPRARRRSRRCSRRTTRRWPRRNARDLAAEAERAAARGRGRGQPRVARGVHRAGPAARDVRGRGPAPRRHRASGPRTRSVCCARDIGASPKTRSRS